MQVTDPRAGLPKLRADWVAAREGDATPTQMFYAKQVGGWGWGWGWGWG